MSTMTVTANPSPCCMQGKPATVIQQAAHGSYLVQVVGGGQYRCTCDHIHDHHPDAVKPDTSSTTDVAPATPECSPGLHPVRLVPASSAAAPVAQATTNPTVAAPAAATANTPRKSSPVVHIPQQPQMPSTGSTLKQTGTVPTALHWSAHVREPTSRLLEEMWPDCPWLMNILNVKIISHITPSFTLSIKVFTSNW